MKKAVVTVVVLILGIGLIFGGYMTFARGRTVEEQDLRKAVPADAELRAPIDGVIAVVNVKENEMSPTDRSGACRSAAARRDDRQCCHRGSEGGGCAGGAQLGHSHRLGNGPGLCGGNLREWRRRRG